MVQGQFHVHSDCSHIHYYLNIQGHFNSNFSYVKSEPIWVSQVKGVLFNKQKVRFTIKRQE